MDQKRRDLLKTGAAAAIGSMFASAQNANAQSAEAQVKLIPPLVGQLGLRLITFVPKAGASHRIGVVLDDGRVVDVGGEAQHGKIKLAFDPASMISLVASGDKGLLQVKALADKAAASKKGLANVNQVKLLSPIPKPQSNVYAVGWNYLEHFEEGKEARADKNVAALPANPVFFTKAVNTMNGPFDPIPYDATNSTATDWEAELALVIGRRGRNIPEDKAMDYVFGYAAYNDTTVRDVQQKRHGGQWFKGKSLDGHGPMGPWIVTTGGIELNDTRIICRVNGVEKQNGSYKQMYFKIPRVIAELSRGLTLEPGDIITTGTPPGVGYSRKPPEFLKPGDVMETEITGLGIIRNPIKSEA
jgi:2-keto-4-pentenoate hydratase/2-oxohepta-3-ene-1,7-dioic acid hydratase in catechol pathway